jgi:hypothetical protein
MGRAGRVGRVTVIWSLAFALAASTVGAPVPAAADDEAAPRIASSEDVAASSTASYPLQWYLETIRAPQAWQRTLGSPDVTIGVVDTGVDPWHEDLWDSMWVDPATGWNGYDHLRGTHVTYVSPDEDWHGTAMAGIAAARGDRNRNYIGVAPRSTVMVMRVYRSQEVAQPPGSFASWSRIVRAVDDAVARGADVIVLSLGGVNGSPALATAISGAGVPVVVAAGNQFADLSAGEASVFPAMYRAPNLVTVAASTQNDRLLGPGPYTEGSNYGVRHVDLAAPGDSILAPLAGGDYLLTDGTSFAAPQVAGALALGRARMPDASASELVGEVVRSARRTAGLDGRVTSGGVLDVAAFLDGILRPACTDQIPAGTFSDVPPGGAHSFNVDCIAWWGVAQGVDGTRFAPARSVTRGQMASFLARTLDVVDQRPEDPPSAFTDTDGHPHEAAIDAVAAAGIAQGQADGRFLPDATVTRAQMASFVVRTLELVLETRMPVDRPWFDDITNSVHRDNIVGAREWGVTLGTSDDPRTFQPGLGITRAQMGSFVARTLDAIARDGGVSMRRVGQS